MLLSKRESKLAAGFPMSLAGFFLLLAIVILLKLTGDRLMPVFMPGGRLKTVTLGWIGGLIGRSLLKVFWQTGPQIAEVNLIGAIIGAILFILFLGFFPFLKIMMGKF